MFGDNVNSHSTDYSDRIASALRELTFRIPDVSLIEHVVNNLTAGIEEDYAQTTPYMGVTRGERVATDGNCIPTPILGKALLDSDVENTREAITGILPPDGLVIVENYSAYASLGRMKQLEQIWPTTT